MTSAQRKFWEGVRDYARAVRRMKKVDFEVAQDALALEQEIEQRLEPNVPLAAVAEEPGRNDQGGPR